MHLQAQQEKSKQRGPGLSRRHFGARKDRHVVEYLSGIADQANGTCYLVGQYMSGIADQANGTCYLVVQYLSGSAAS